MFHEPFLESWTCRYGAAPTFELQAIDRFLTHRSIRKYRDEPISEETVRGLIAAAQSASTSSNLQLWSVISVQNPERRETIARLCDDQSHVRDAAWFLAFLADHHRLRNAAQSVGEPAAGLDYNEFYTMAIIDAALAAERLVCAAESLGIGVCYIGALRNDPEGVRQFFGLPPGVFGVFGLCLGWPAVDLASEIKPRLSQGAVWFHETYNPSPDVEEYDDRMRSFYKRQGMKGEATWSMRSGRRVDGNHMTGREVLQPWLQRQGFDRR